MALTLTSLTMITRLHFLLLCFCVLPLHAQSPPAAPPNIILFVCDDLGLQLGCYGDGLAKTPGIDRLASQGVRYTQAYGTTASCSPSRAVLLSGLHSHSTGQYGLQHPPHNFHSLAHPTLPSRLAEAGYRTARIGKFHVGPETHYPFQEIIKAHGRRPSDMVQQCRDLFTAKSDKPFFLYFCTADPHRDSKPRTDLPESPNNFGNVPESGVKFSPATMPVPPWLPDTPACRAELAQYYQSISRVDAGVSKLMELLVTTDKAQNTIIIFTSDNGPPWPGAKTTAYDPGLHLPLIIKDPRSERRGVTCDHLVSLLDLTPTILASAGAAYDAAGMHGISFAHTLGAAVPPSSDAAVYISHTFHEVTMYYPMRGIRTAQWKLLINLAHPLPFPGADDLLQSATWQDTLKSNAQTYGQRPLGNYLQRPQLELYNLTTDPHEIKNLATAPEHATVRAELLTKVKAMQEKTKDPWIMQTQKIN